MDNPATELELLVAEWAAQNYVADWGLAPANAPAGSEKILQWVADGHQGAMAWFADTAAWRANMQARFPEVQTVIAVAFACDQPTEDNGGLLPHISRYARGRDYHTVLHKRMRKLTRALRAMPACSFAWTSVDSGPVSEKRYAQAAGLGWIGRNTNLIHRQLGSYMLLALVACDIPFAQASSSAPAQVLDACGSCTACVDICPTAAIHPDGYVISDRCISYQTIELPREDDYRTTPAGHSHGWLHGCDDCQEVCPWVQQARRRNTQPHDPAFKPHARWRELTIARLAAMSEEEIDRLLTGTPLARERARGLQQNAAALLRAGTPLPITSRSKARG